VPLGVAGEANVTEDPIAPLQPNPTRRSSDDPPISPDGVILLVTIAAVAGASGADTCQAVGMGPVGAVPAQAPQRAVPARVIEVLDDHDAPRAERAHVRVGAPLPAPAQVHAKIFGPLGCVGCVTDGAVRDLNEARGDGIPFRRRGAVGLARIHARRYGGEPVEIAGLLIARGDLLHADQLGALKMPPEIAAELPAAAERLIESE
jgi:hypothetical protein